jgi:CRISPR-associated exonuclease Cas4
MTANPIDMIDAPFRVTDLKQWVYCPRVLYYTTCTPDVRPITYKMEAGIEAGRDEEERETRRSLRAYGFPPGRREFDVPVSSTRLGLRGQVDLVIWVEGSEQIKAIPVDYKLSEAVSKHSSEHFKLQLAAYGMLLEEKTGAIAETAYLYSIPLRKAQKILLDGRLRAKLLETLEAMHAMLWRETMPTPTQQPGKCLSCEFRRFCNDVL